MDCHEGDVAIGQYGEYEEVHERVVVDPSAIGKCDGCHADIAAATANSLHTNLWGEKAMIEKRGMCTFEETPGVVAGFGRNCNGCHTTCGQCHVSRPNSVAGGLAKAHQILKTPDQTQHCTACHGSRIGHDFKGEAVGVNPDIHYIRGHRCEFCHGAEEIHGDGLSTNDSGHYEHRYEVETMPRCENCHVKEDIDADNVGNDDWEGVYHDAHWEGFTGVNLQCQVCHSQPYKNCTNCHTGPPGGDHAYEIEPSVIALKIGQNTLPDQRGEYDYVIVRHTPIHQDTYAEWGLTLPAYDSEPTWKYASPHNIRSWTDQTEVEEGMTCGSSCHDRPGEDPKGYYLRPVDLLDEHGVELPDAAANQSVIITEDDLH